jgi:hypothetical protein
VREKNRFLTAGALQPLQQTTSRFERGTVIHALPYAHWYKVQFGRGWDPCCALENAGILPIGPSDTRMYPPGTPVLVCKSPGLPHGIILGAIPLALLDATVAVPDCVLQGGGSGLQREAAHIFPVRNTSQAGGVRFFSAGRPLDGTSFDWGVTTPTGIMLHIDDAQAFLRINEACGLFLNYLDSYARLAGMQLDIEVRECRCVANEAAIRASGSSPGNQLVCVGRKFLIESELIQQSGRGLVVVIFTEAAAPDINSHQLTLGRV